MRGEIPMRSNLSSGIPCSMVPKDVTQPSTPANANMRQPPISECTATKAEGATKIPRTRVTRRLAHSHIEVIISDNLTYNPNVELSESIRQCPGKKI